MYYLLQLDKGAKVLDIGCGMGNYTAALNHKGLSMTGLDISSAKYPISLIIYWTKYGEDWLWTSGPRPFGGG
ncbi:class I SAM-dependent methyltransferase [Syntrophobotulus glycolicus]|uniref:class I SAM-dependent methyltransferase n=1 Tax=Syntrophobotulus glycolicus TaxID=51197 RepID=UPI00030A4617|nr:class I SAM-dependent methyltransferase [Syntrophobotulus glycolicus]